MPFIEHSEKDVQAMLEVIGARSIDDPGYNLGGDPYFTDGLRAVLQCTDHPTQFSEIQLFNWEWRPEDKPYMDNPD